MADSYVGREVAGQFRIVERIGSGGMGAVYKADQPQMNRHVAIKILHSRYLSRKDLVSRFRREARAMSHLSHPNTARVFMYGQLEDGACYFVMEHLEGRNLAQLVRRDGPMEPKRAIHVMAQVCGALDEAHRAGIIHRDLKPENIFLTNQGGIQDYPKVLDFGLAKVTEKQMRPGSMILTREGMVFGTPEFMSPEQARGKTLDPRSDIYSLGIILYELLSGKLPFEARQPIEFIQLHVNEPPILLADRMPPDRELPPRARGSGDEGASEGSGRSLRDRRRVRRSPRGRRRGPPFVRGLPEPLRAFERRAGRWRAGASLVDGPPAGAALAARTDGATPAAASPAARATAAGRNGPIAPPLARARCRRGPRPGRSGRPDLRPPSVTARSGDPRP